jgi:hypothetical protein
MARITKLLLLLTTLILCFYGFSKENDKKSDLSKIATNDDAEYIAVNECFMWVANNGMGSHSPIIDDSGFYLPGGENATIPSIYTDGLLWGAKVDGEIRVNGSTFRHGLQAGKILGNGQADDPNNPRYRIYKVRKDWEQLPEGPKKKAYQKDYEEWPVEDGAPWIDKNLDGIYVEGIDEPQFLGDEMLWFVSNDLDSNRTKFTYGSPPIGLEIQNTIFGFANTGDLGDMLFKKYKIINKSGQLLEDMYISYFSDVDLGNAGDDFIGCDSTLSLAYGYNADNNDEYYYGENPPAVGYVLLKNYEIMSELDLKLSSFLAVLKHWFYPFHADMGSYEGTLQFYNTMQGLSIFGDSIINPRTNSETKFMFEGNPVEKTGWYQGQDYPNGPNSGFDQHLMSSGPFTMAPGDTQEVVLGIIMARGSDNLQSITELRKKTKKAIILNDNNFKFVPDIPIPKVKYYAEDKSVTIYWDSEVEDYNEIDELNQDKDYDDSSYTFEGYLLRQYSDINGSNGKIIASSDIKNNFNKLVKDHDQADISIMRFYTN